MARTLKPRVEGLVEETEIRDFGGTFVGNLSTTLWRVSCPCHRRGEFDYSIALVATWERAIDLALEHGRIYH